MTKAVIFDMGNVLIGWDAHSPYRRLLPDPEDHAAFFQGLFREIYTTVHDDHRSMGEALAAVKERHPDHLALIEQYELRWVEFLTGVMPDSIALLERLHAQGVRLLGLTNWPHQVWPPQDMLPASERSDFEFLNLFEDIVVSGQHRMAKPDPAFFHMALERWALPPSDGFFVDDMVENVEAARGVGLRAHHFTSAAGLKRDLMQAGLLTERG